MRLSRRTFLSFVPAVSLLHLRPSLQSVPSELVLEQCLVAGFAHHQGPELFDELHKGVEPVLVREPGNPHDPRAVRLEHRGAHIGYIPKRCNSSVSRLLDQGARLRCTITRVDAGAPASRAVEVEVRLRGA